MDYSETQCGCCTTVKLMALRNLFEHTAEPRDHWIKMYAQKELCEGEEKGPGKCDQCGCELMSRSIDEWKKTHVIVGHELVKDLIYYHRKKMQHLINKPRPGEEFLTQF